MDRRVAAGLVAVMLQVGSSARGQAPRPAPDPSAMGPVGLAPLRSLDTLNGIPGMAGTTPPSAAIPPGSLVRPTPSGPPAVVPSSPDGSSPVGLSPLPTISESINARDPGATFPRAGVSAWFRRGRARGGSPTPAGRMFPAPSAPTPTAAPPPRLDPATIPSGFPTQAGPDPEPASAAPASAAPSGRPAPYANQVPQGPRPQADAPTSADAGAESVAGRPAPLASDRPRGPRPRAAADSRPRPRPLASPTTAPRPRGLRPASGPASGGAEPAVPVVVVPPPSPIEPVEVPSPPPALELPPLAEPGPAPPVGLPPFDAAQPPSAADAPRPPSPPLAEPAPAADAELKKAGGDAIAIRSRLSPARDLPFATLRAAAVGDEVITLHEVEVVVNEEFRKMTGGQPMPAAERNQLKNQLAAQTLDHLIDQSLLIQEAKRQMKNPKAMQQFDDFVDKKWHDEELAPLLRATATANEHELKRKLAEQGKSYAEMKEGFRKNMLAHDYLMSKIKSRVNSDLVEQLAYYNEHLKAFDQPARMTWREIEVNAAKYPDRAAARRQAETLLARLARNEAFDSVARAASDGPTASKGGLYVDMTPGGYGIPSVNEELNRIAEGKPSGIIEAPNSYHIILVESRREAGPLRFDEVQDKVREEVFRRNFMQARTEYLAKLRSKTLIRTMFQDTESDPARVRHGDAQVRSASTR